MTSLRSAEILAVGSELLTPHRVDTNSLFLTGRLNEAGIDVIGKAVVGDVAADVKRAVGAALERVDVVVLTGGLGPTSDDVTREAVADLLAAPLELDERVLAAIEGRFARRGIAMPDTNRRQALVPRGAVVLENANGTAPGLWIDVGPRVLLLLPGPPRELQPIFENGAWPRLSARAGERRVRRRVLKIAGRPESLVEQIANPIYAPLESGDVPIQTTILAAPGQVELHLSARGANVDEMDRALQGGVDALAEALAPAVFSVDGRSLEMVVGETLRQRGWRIAVAESCTGGLVLGRLTDVAGSSAWVVGGVVAYDNAVKVRELGVPQELIDQHGAVSEPVAAAMAEGVRTRLGADVGVGVTGIAGPSGGSDAKPVGTVVIAVIARQAQVRTFAFPGERTLVRQQSVLAALDMVRRVV